MERAEFRDRYFASIFDADPYHSEASDIPIVASQIGSILLNYTQPLAPFGIR
jgi:hypothetical protein